MADQDVVIIGAGLVGLATAYTLLLKRPDLKITVLDKESGPAHHQSGHNSGVLHTGVYYKPGSLKAKNCIRGKALLEEFCRQNQISFELCGKLIVASSPEDIPRLHALAERATQHGVQNKLVSISEAKEREPFVTGLEALVLPTAGIVDYPAVAKTFVRLLEKQGATVLFGSAFKSAKRVDNKMILTQENGNEIKSSVIVNCAGLHSDRIAKLLGGNQPIKIVPFRGEYYELKAERKDLCKHLIYPVPDPSFPFLGVHLTRMIGGGVECGPNAVLALRREGYSWKDFSFNDLFETVGFAGFRKFALKHWKMGSAEIYRSLSKQAFVNSIKELVPDVQVSDLVPGGSGVRAQAMHANGSLVDDFAFDIQVGVVSVLNAPSPAATSCLSLGEYISDEVFKQISM